MRRLAALRAIVEHIAAGRWDSGIRLPSDSELRATLVLGNPLTEASAKIRQGPPHDFDDDLPRAVWAGELPLKPQPQLPIEDSRGIEVPDHVARWSRST
jgi:hypothetical protein